MTDNDKAREIEIVCDFCQSKLTQLGGLLFSPPDANGMAKKQHICVSCFPAIESQRRTIEEKDRECSLQKAVILCDVSYWQDLYEKEVLKSEQLQASVKELEELADRNKISLRLSTLKMAKAGGGIGYDPAIAYYENLITPPGEKK